MQAGAWRVPVNTVGSIYDFRLLLVKYSNSENLKEHFPVIGKNLNFL